MVNQGRRFEPYYSLICATRLTPRSVGEPNGNLLSGCVARCKGDVGISALEPVGRQSIGQAADLFRWRELGYYCISGSWLGLLHLGHASLEGPLQKKDACNDCAQACTLSLHQVSNFPAMRALPASIFRKKSQVHAAPKKTWLKMTGRSMSSLAIGF